VSGDALLRRLFLGALERVAPAGPTARALAALDLADSIVLLATGKAALGMADGAEAALGERIAARVVVAPAGSGEARAGRLFAAHPVPDATSEAAGRALLAAASAARPDQDIVALISGGGSALTAVPAAGLTLADKAAAIARVMAAGAPIGDINCVRRHLSALKGGRLARAAPARVTTLVVSDVIGDALHEVASGPTVPDPSSFADACAVIERWVGWDALPAAAARRLQDGRQDRGPGLAAPRPADRAILLLGLGALVDAAAAEARAARDLAVPVEVVDERLAGPVEQVAEALAARMFAARGARLLVAGGEPTVALPADRGRSGRAHHLALLMARALAANGAPGDAVLVAGSDGADGESGAAGAVVDHRTWERMRAAGLDPDARLARCDAADALARAGAQIATGPTGVNHADLVLALRAPQTETVGEHPDAAQR
jgi:glycerate 2-kinase